MSGRYAKGTDHGIAVVFDTMQTAGDKLPPSCNVAPTQPVRVILNKPHVRNPTPSPSGKLRTVSWGLLPARAKDRKMTCLLFQIRT